MTHPSREDITGALGDLDDATIAEIMQSGATADELALAAAAVRDGEPADERVLELCDVVAPLVVDPDPEESGEYPATD